MNQIIGEIITLMIGFFLFLIGWIYSWNYWIQKDFYKFRVIVKGEGKIKIGYRSEVLIGGQNILDMTNPQPIMKAIPMRFNKIIINNREINITQMPGTDTMNMQINPELSLRTFHSLNDLENKKLYDFYIIDSGYLNKQYIGLTNDCINEYYAEADEYKKLVGQLLSGWTGIATSYFIGNKPNEQSVYNYLNELISKNTNSKQIISAVNQYKKFNRKEFSKYILNYQPLTNMLEMAQQTPKKMCRKGLSLNICSFLQNIAIISIFFLYYIYINDENKIYIFNQSINRTSIIKFMFFYISILVCLSNIIFITRSNINCSKNTPNEKCKVSYTLGFWCSIIGGIIMLLAAISLYNRYYLIK